MSDCPGYLGMSVLNAVDLTRLVHRDLVVFCPPQFNATVRLRRFAPDQQSADGGNTSSRQRITALVVRFTDADGRSNDFHVTLFRVDETKALAQEQLQAADTAIGLEEAATATVALRLTVAVCACGLLAAIFVVNYVGREVLKSARASVNSGTSAFCDIIDAFLASCFQLFSSCFQNLE
jgi:hypothetical protein